MDAAGRAKWHNAERSQALETVVALCFRDLPAAPVVKSRNNFN